VPNLRLEISGLSPIFIDFSMPQQALSFTIILKNFKFCTAIFSHVAQSRQNWKCLILKMALKEGIKFANCCLPYGCMTSDNCDGYNVWLPEIYPGTFTIDTDVTFFISSPSIAWSRQS
jgi:hypothetical protein